MGDGDHFGETRNGPERERQEREWGRRDDELADWRIRAVTAEREHEAVSEDRRHLRAEVERLRECLEAWHKRATELLDLDRRHLAGHSFAAYLTSQRQDMGSVLAATPAAPSSEYRRGYERAVEDAVTAVERVLRKRHAFYRDVGWAEIAVIRSLLPVAEREGSAS